MIGGDRTAEAHEEKSGVDPLVARRPLPAAGRMDATRGDVRGDGVGERNEARSSLVAANATVRTEPGDAAQSTVSPRVRLELPDARVGLLPALRNRGSGSVGGATADGIEAVVPGRMRKQQQRLPEYVELELSAGLVPDEGAAAGIPRQIEFTLLGHALSVDCVHGLESRPVGEQPVGDEPDRVVEQG